MCIASGVSSFQDIYNQGPRYIPNWLPFCILGYVDLVGIHALPYGLNVLIGQWRSHPQYIPSKITKRLKKTCLYSLSIGNAECGAQP